MTELTPREIVSELDKFIIGQNSAKKAVAIALRSRWRRKKVNSPLREEIFPKNILMIGPTGVGKTEISRRLSKLASAPFLKVEATKFTEVGYVGRDVDQIVRDLIDSSIVMTKDKMRKEVETKAQALLDGEAMKRLREHRDNLLKETDWVVTKASETGVAETTAWKTYRQELRDLPSSATPEIDGMFIKNVTWPTKPS